MKRTQILLSVFFIAALAFCFVQAGCQALTAAGAPGSPTTQALTNGSQTLDAGGQAFAGTPIGTVLTISGTILAAIAGLLVHNYQSNQQAGNQVVAAVNATANAVAQATAPGSPIATALVPGSTMTSVMLNTASPPKT